MKVSFDFDGVLSQLAWQTVAVGMIEHGEDVYIVTARCQDRGARVYDIADRLDIPRGNVVFTCNRDKWEAIQQEGIELHVDNNQEQLDLIQELTEAVGINAGQVEPYDLLRRDLEDDLPDNSTT